MSYVFLMSSLTLLAVSARTEVVLEYERGPGTESCSNADDFQKGVAKRLDYNPFTPEAAETLRVTLTHSAQGFHAAMKREDSLNISRGERFLTSSAPDCSALMSALELSVAVLLDPQKMLLSEHSEEGSDDTDLSDTTKENRDVAPPVIAPGTEIVRTRIPLHLRTGLGVSQHFGLAPSVGIAGSALMSLEMNSFLLDVSGHFSIPQELEVTPGAVVIGSTYAQFSPCRKFGNWGACATTKLGAFRLQSRDLFSAKNAYPLLWTAGGRGTYDISLSVRWSLRLETQLEGFITQTTVSVTNKAVWSHPGVLISGGIYLIFLAF